MILLSFYLYSLIRLEQFTAQITLQSWTMNICCLPTSPPTAFQHPAFRCFCILFWFFPAPHLTQQKTCPVFTVLVCEEQYSTKLLFCNMPCPHHCHMHYELTSYQAVAPVALNNMWSGSMNMLHAHCLSMPSSQNSFLYT